LTGDYNDSERYLGERNRQARAGRGLN
jgi:hypothetical protein